MQRLLLALCLLIAGNLFAQDKSNKGKEFWLGYGNNILFDHDNPFNQQVLSLYLSTEEETDVTVSVNATSWSTTVHIPAHTVNYSIQIPKDGPDDCRIWDEGVFERAIHIISEKPIVAYAHQYAYQLSGATMLMPVETYGYTYYVINYDQPYVPGTPGKNWFFVVASEDNTTIEITPTDTTGGGRLSGLPYRINLNKGELYNAFGKITNEVSKDLTGTKVSSVEGSDGTCHPVAVFSGNSRFIVCATDGGEIAQQQIFPASAWGTRYLTFHCLNTVSAALTTPYLNYYRVVVSKPGTIVKRNGVVLSGINKKGFYEFASTEGDYIEADNPVMLCQYTPNSNQCTGNSLSPQGDPEMFFLSPIEQGIKKSTVYNTKNANVTVNYLSVFIPVKGLASLKINGVAPAAGTYITHPANSNYYVVAKRLLGSSAQYTIESDSAFTAQIYGTGFWESYGYIAGTLVNNLNAVAQIQNLYNITGEKNNFTCPKTPLKFTIKLAYKASSIEWLFSQASGGVSPAKDTTIVNPVPTDSQIVNGRKYYSYTLDASYTFSETGTFYVPVTYHSPDIDNCSLTEKASVTVEVKKGPLSDFSIAYSRCTSDTARLSGVSTAAGYNIVKYAWGFANGDTDSTTSLMQLFSEGDHTITYTLIADNGCFGDTTKIISTYAEPVASFSYDRNICTGDSIRLVNESTISSGNIANYHWSFGDGNTTVTNLYNPFFHTYSNTDSFTVSLVAVSDNACLSDTFYSKVYVNPKPTAAIIISGKPCVDSAILFKADVQPGGNNILQQWYWQFGDGQSFTADNGNAITHIYSTAQQNVQVKLAVHAGPGCSSDTAEKMVAFIRDNPVAAFRIDGNIFCDQKDIRFADAGTSSSATVWKWNFGNSTSNTIPPFTRQFSTGDYVVSLYTETAEGCGSAPDIQPLTIYPNPQVYAGADIILKKGNIDTLLATVSNADQYKLLWSPADYLSSTTILNPLTNAEKTIVYKITAYEGPGNCSGEDSVKVTVLNDIFIPGAFSPNADGLNDVWNIPLISNNPDAMVSIYNRWGQLILQSRGYYTPWNGTYNGKVQPAGTYIYIIIPNVNEARKITGTVTIIR